MDFSGARDAHTRIWIASGRLAGSMLVVESCVRAAELPGSPRGLEASLAALRDFVANHRDGVFGFDFPFGLPLACCGGPWGVFVRSFGKRFRDAGDFRAACWTAAGRRESRRRTDRESGTPFCPYNLRLYRQTYHGVRDVLGPLLREGVASVLPMQQPQPARAWIVEICPASVLKKEGLYRPYKGRADERRRARGAILHALEGRRVLRVPARVGTVIVGDRGGDALDAVVAALATGRAVLSGFRVPDAGRRDYMREGYVYR